jgi:hypothetical protein
MMPPKAQVVMPSPSSVEFRSIMQTLRFGAALSLMITPRIVQDVKDARTKNRDKNLVRAKQQRQDRSCERNDVGN